MAIFFRHSFKVGIRNFVKDPFRRWLWINAQIGTGVCNFVNYDFPIPDQVEVLLRLYSTSVQFKGPIITGGDFNPLKKQKLDALRKNIRQPEPKTAGLISTFKTKIGLIDPWQFQILLLRQNTCYTASHSAASRVDFFKSPSSKEGCIIKLL